jgi:hypothetical protein
MRAYRVVKEEQRTSRRRVQTHLVKHAERLLFILPDLAWEAFQHLVGATRVLPRGEDDGGTVTANSPIIAPKRATPELDLRARIAIAKRSIRVAEPQREVIRMFIESEMNG